MNGSDGIKMGVSRFIGTYVEPCPSVVEEMLRKCVAVAIDMNQFLHLSLEDLEESRKIGSEGTTIEMDEKITDVEELLAAYAFSARRVIKGIIDELSKITKLRELYILMDGTPCYGKLQNQIDRRRKSKRYMTKGRTKLLMSSALILPGTPLMEVFTHELRAAMEELARSQPQLMLQMSLSDIPGEGEHKAMDYLSSSAYTSFTSSNDRDEWFMIWANDSDVFISLIHRPVSNVYVMTDIVRGMPPRQTKTTKCIDLAHVRKLLCNDSREVQNCPLLLSFAGNDYLPEMLNSNNLSSSYMKAKEVSAGLTLTKFLAPSDTRVIDFSNLRTFLGLMKEEEVTLYWTNLNPPPIPGRPPLRGAGRALLFAGKIEDVNRDRIGFKRDYYTMVHKYLRDVGVLESMNREVVESDLYDLEMLMASSYLRTYTWYYYYQSGFHVGSPLNNSYYSYIFPPLYSSLHLLLSGENDPMLSFDASLNPALIPIRRELDYFEKLPVLTQLHHYIVLQEEDYRLLYPDGSVYSNTVFESEKKRVIQCPSIVQRGSGGPLEISKRAPIEQLVNLYASKDVRNAIGNLITLGQVRTRTVTFKQGTDRYRVRGTAEFA